MFDAGFKWILRIGRYENSSDYTSWDWIEQKRGVMATVPELDDYVDSLVENGVNIQVQLMYGNVMYTSPSGKLPDVGTPEPGSFHNDDRGLYSVFWAPTTPDQIAAFNRYVAVQAKYVPRGLIYNHAAGVKTFVWLLAAGADGNEYDDFGIIHGITNHDTDLMPRPVFLALQNTNALFADTKFDASIEISGVDLPALRRQTGYPFMSYGFRSAKGKAVVAYWLAAHSLPGNSFPPLYTTLSLKNTGITHPVVVDVVSGKIKPAAWKQGTTDTLELLPLKDSIMAVTDESYFDWPVLPEAPSSLNVNAAGDAVKLTWQGTAGTRLAWSWSGASRTGKKGEEPGIGSQVWRRPRPYTAIEMLGMANVWPIESVQ